MKMIRFSKYVALVIILASVFGCDDAEMKAIDNGLYIQEAAPSNKFDQQIITQLVDDEEVVKTLTVRLVRAMDHDVTVTLDIDPQLLEEYNNKNEANYLVLPEEYRNFEAHYVMQIYMSKYKLTTKKQLLNACDRYFQRKELRSEIQIADAYLKETESSIMCSFQEMTNSVQRSMNSMITAIDSQNYELEKVKQKTEKDRKNAELLLDWNLMK